MNKINFIKENLERRFNALKDIQNIHDMVGYFHLELDYITFVFTDQTLGIIFKELVHERKVSKPLLQRLYDSFIIMASLRAEKAIILPNFLDIEIEKEFGLYRDFVAMINNADEEYTEKKKNGTEKELFELDNLGLPESTTKEFYKIQQLHNDLMEKLSLPLSNKATFKNGVLTLKEKELNFNTKQNQKDLLMTLFKDLQRDWFYTDIFDDWGESAEFKNEWRKLYTAGDEINKAIAIETQIKDFIIKDTKKIRINPKYLA